jgi:hypothetical protein
MENILYLVIGAISGVGGTIVVNTNTPQWIGAILIVIAELLLIIHLFAKLFWGSYEIICNGNIWSPTISFQLSLWKRVILFGAKPKLGNVKAEIEYRYEDQDLWSMPAEAKWKETNTLLLNVDDATRGKLIAFQSERPLIPLVKICGDKPFIGDVRIKIALKRQRDDALIKEFEIHTFID